MKGESPTGWMAYVRKYKELHPEATIDYKELLKQYIGGIKLG